MLKLHRAPAGRSFRVGWESLFHGKPHLKTQASATCVWHPDFIHLLSSWAGVSFSQREGQGNCHNKLEGSSRKRLPGLTVRSPKPLVQDVVLDDFPLGLGMPRYTNPTEVGITTVPLSPRKCPK